MAILGIVFGLTVFLQYTFAEIQPITRQTKLGPITGLRYSHGRNTGIETYLNIPYAKSPTGNLRYGKPVEYGSWNGTWNATTYGPACIQFNDIFAPLMHGMSEDCLQLNIHVPLSEGTNGNKSVMVWIHGGGYITGTASLYNGSKLAEVGDVIVVTINYRIGIFGFLSYNDSLVKGNFGLWDQIMALEWVNKNIYDYGGNPNDVTIFGESAGGFSVGLLSLIPRNKGLFHRAILESGVGNSLFAIGKAFLASVGTGEEAGCKFSFLSSDHSKTLLCMRALSTNDTLKAALKLLGEFSTSTNMGTSFGPDVDGELFNNDPSEIIANKTSPGFLFFKSLDIMVGNCDMEGSLLLLMNEAVQQKYKFNITDGIPNSYFCGTMVPSITKDYLNNNKDASHAICKEYGVMDNLAEQSRQVLNMYTDLFFISPAVSALHLHNDGNFQSQTYQFIFSQKSPFPYGPKRPLWYKGSGHASELVYLFSLEDDEKMNPNVTVTDWDHNLALQMRKYWTNFAKTGDPNSAGLPNWPPYHDGTRLFLQLNEKNMTLGNNYRDKQMKFWLKTIPDISPFPNNNEEGDEKRENSHQRQYVTRQTKLGKLTGLKYSNGTHNGIEMYFNIPYAKAPNGELRFAKPVTFGKWGGTLNATVFGPACIQFEYNSLVKHMSEDCLKLNVYVPTTANNNQNKSVMVWIHGGAYIGGSGSLYDGSKIAAVGDVVVVTINYRLGLLGFMTYNDSLVKGNYGLWDQIMALEWVKNNIDDYGGNPNDVTIFGESAGGFSVGLLTLIPSNRGLFHRAIAESGVGNSLFSIGKPVLLSIGTSDEAGCIYKPSNASHSETLQCMRQLSVNKILIAAYKIYEQDANSTHIQISYSPAVDGELFEKYPSQLLADKTSAAYSFFRSLDVIIGNCDMEGSLLLNTRKGVQKAYGFNITVGIPNTFFCDTLIPTLSGDYFNSSQAVSNAICKEYGVMDNLAEQSRQVLNMYTDLFFISPAVSTLSTHNSGNNETKQYQYIFSQINPFVKKKPSWYRGSGHGSELSYLFDLEIQEKENPNVNVTSADHLLAYQMRKYWSNFAKTGDPNSIGLPLWPAYNNTNRIYLQLNERNMTVGSHYRQNEMTFWLKTIPNMLTPNSGQTEKAKVTITTKLGHITGKKDVKGAKILHQFLNIPYGKPPTGNLRFSKPERFGNWNGTLDATKHGPACVQKRSRYTLFGISEDCLTLNIYVPNNISRTSTNSVMVWIHGGGYYTQTASFYDGSMLAVTGDVIIVTINYRLGALGFLSFNDSTVKGNFGIHDQILALKWVHDNIDDYGGNPDDVTIFGESAGGWSVGLLSLIPQNKGLFHRVIAQSGVANSFKAIGSTELLSKDLGNALGCNNLSGKRDIKQTLQCLREKDAMTLQKATEMLMEKSQDSTLFAEEFVPIVDGELFTSYPNELLVDRSSPAYLFYQSLDIMIGNCEGDLLLLMSEHVQEQHGFNISYGIPYDYFCNSMTPALSVKYYKNNTKVSTAICKQYGIMNNLVEQSRQAVNMFSDVFFIAPTVVSLQAHTESTRSLYQYIFSQVPNMAAAATRPSWFKGSGHGTDIVYLFFAEFIEIIDPKANFTEKDLLLATQIRKYWTNFAKTGNPNSRDLPTWPKYTNTDGLFLQLSKNNMAVGTKYSDKRVQFWLKTIPKLSDLTSQDRFFELTSINRNVKPQHRLLNLSRINQDFKQQNQHIDFSRVNQASFTHSKLQHILFLCLILSRIKF